MDYTNQSVKLLFYGPILHTPQGFVVLFFSVAYLFCAALVGLLGATPPFGWQEGKTVALCIAWPLVLFMYFVKDNQPSFKASLPAAGWLAFYGVAPVLFLLWHT
jgi:hypothetical protein